MKRIILFACAAALAALFASPATAQERRDRETQYLFGNNENMEIGGFGGVIFEAGGMYGDNPGVFFGGGGGVLFNKSFFIGGFGQGMMNTVEETLPAGAVGLAPRRAEMDFGYGGLWLGYAPVADKAVHPTIGFKFGGGGVSWNRIDGDDEDEYFSDGVIVLQPQAGVELNIVEWMRINVVGGYRFVTGLNLPYTEPGDLDGAYGGLIVKFGSF